MWDHWREWPRASPRSTCPSWAASSTTAAACWATRAPARFSASPPGACTGSGCNKTCDAGPGSDAGRPLRAVRLHLVLRRERRRQPASAPTTPGARGCRPTATEANIYGAHTQIRHRRLPGPGRDLPGWYWHRGFGNAPVSRSRTFPRRARCTRRPTRPTPRRCTSPRTTSTPTAPAPSGGGGGERPLLRPGADLGLRRQRHLRGPLPRPRRAARGLPPVLLPVPRRRRRPAGLPRRRLAAGGARPGGHLPGGVRPRRRSSPPTARPACSSARRAASRPATPPTTRPWRTASAARAGRSAATASGAPART